MKTKTVFVFIVAFGLTSYVNAYEPSPLKDIKINFSSSQSSTGGYSYTYMISNPASNAEGVFSIELFLDFDPNLDVTVSAEGLVQCPRYGRKTSESARQRKTIISVGSAAPDHWSCGYGTLKGYVPGVYGWGAFRERDEIKPGSSLSGFSLSSYAPPGIREILVQPGIDYEKLPPEYEENVDRTVALVDKIKWVGKTVGPKAPPKVFKVGEFIQYLISLKDQSSSLGWITDGGILKSLEAKLDQIKKKIDAGDTKTAKNVLAAFLAEVEAQNGKHLSPEAYALLKFNGKYLLDRL